MLRLHFGFESSGGHLLNLSRFKLDPQECAEDLYQCIEAFIDDNLLTEGCGIKHHGKAAYDEPYTPMVENLCVLTWLSLVDRDLPTLVQDRIVVSIYLGIR